MKTTATGATVNFNQGLQDKRYTLFRFRTKIIIENIVYKARTCHTESSKIPTRKKFAPS